MSETMLLDCQILVVEDDYMLADELQRELGDAGALVLGPIGAVEDAVILIGSEQHIDGAVLDVNLHGAWFFPAADLLVERSVPFVFTTGHDTSSIPTRFRHVVRCEKSVSPRNVTQAIARAVHS